MARSRGKSPIRSPTTSSESYVISPSARSFVPFSLRGFGFSDTAIAVVGGRRRGHTPFLFRIPFGWFSTIPKDARKDHSEDDGCERDRENNDEDGAMVGWSVDI